MKYLPLVIVLFFSGCFIDDIKLTPGTPTDPVIPDLTITNEYGADIYVEIWSGRSLEYLDGKVLGYDLVKEVSLSMLTTTVAGKTITSNLQQELELLVIIGVDTGTYIRHLNDKKFTSIVKGVSFLIDSSGNIVKQ